MDNEKEMKSPNPKPELPLMSCNTSGSVSVSVSVSVSGSGGNDGNDHDHNNNNIDNSNNSSSSNNNNNNNNNNEEVKEDGETITEKEQEIFNNKRRKVEHDNDKKIESPSKIQKVDITIPDAKPINNNIDVIMDTYTGDEDKDNDGYKNENTDDVQKDENDTNNYEKSENETKINDLRQHGNTFQGENDNSTGSTNENSNSDSKKIKKKDMDEDGGTSNGPEIDYKRDKNDFDSKETNNQDKDENGDRTNGEIEIGSDGDNNRPISNNNNNIDNDDNDDDNNDNESNDYLESDSENNNDDNNHESNQESEMKQIVTESIVDLDAGTVIFPTLPVHKQLICSLCNGLYRDPFTISECLHTFCKTCIFFAFQDIGEVSCPKCKVKLGPDPFKAILFDRTMQELVDKLFPDLKEQDIKEEKTFWDMMDKGKGEEVAFAAAKVVADAFKFGSSSGSGSGSGGSTRTRRKKLAISKRGQSKQRQLKKDESNSSCKTRSQQIIDLNNYIPPPDEMHLRLYPLVDGKLLKYRLPALEKPSLQTSGRLRIVQIKKYIIQRLGKIDSILPKSIEVQCNGVQVGDELSLTFIKKTRWLDPAKDLTLHYRLDRNSSD